jgi:hypothetical protein
MYTVALQPIFPSSTSQNDISHPTLIRHFLLLRRLLDLIVARFAYFCVPTFSLSFPSAFFFHIFPPSMPSPPPQMTSADNYRLLLGGCFLKYIVLCTSCIGGAFRCRSEAKPSKMEGTFLR